MSLRTYSVPVNDCIQGEIMALIHNLGLPRIGPKRELKFALESYWRGESSQQTLYAAGKQIRLDNIKRQKALDFVPVGDFSFYDQVLDMSARLGNLPTRAQSGASPLDQYFMAARGRSNTDSNCAASDMTKWFDTNYHYLVPEISAKTTFTPNAQGLIDQVKEAQAEGANPKPVLVGPLTYLWLGKARDEGEVLNLLPALLDAYQSILSSLAAAGVHWVQIDEPILVLDLPEPWLQAFEQAYHKLNTKEVNILLATYFGGLKEQVKRVCELPVAGLHVDAIRAQEEVPKVLDWLPAHKILSLGVIDGRNIWKTDLNATLAWLKPIANDLKTRLWIAPSCSLLHVPVSMANENEINTEVKPWLAFAEEKLTELYILGCALNQDVPEPSVQVYLANNKKTIVSRQQSPMVHNPKVKSNVQSLHAVRSVRNSAYAARATIQSTHLTLPQFPTTTIGSFPQTPDIRAARKQFKQGTLSSKDYKQFLEAEIKSTIDQQEAVGLDVLVHGEAERNDMVEYFGQQLEGFVFSQYGWVQSYGSRCVKPPILFGDVSRPNAMTVGWAAYAQSLTNKPVKGMLTGPVTVLNWSFVRDDQPRHVSAYQLALAIREEVLDLEAAGIRIIQIDEAALREGLPLRQTEWQNYLDWAVKAFQITANGVKDKTQIHTHMCYSEFNDIIEAIANMDADVITIETSRSNGELLEAFENFEYPNGIGPGVYDIHSPNVPDEQSIVELMTKSARCIPKERLWVNPDCGLKTRRWDEVTPALKNMVAAAKRLRQQAL